MQIKTAGIWQSAAAVASLALALMEASCLSMETESICEIAFTFFRLLVVVVVVWVCLLPSNIYKRFKRITRKKWRTIYQSF